MRRVSFPVGYRGGWSRPRMQSHDTPRPGEAPTKAHAPSRQFRANRRTNLLAVPGSRKGATHDSRAGSSPARLSGRSNGESRLINAESRIGIISRYIEDKVPFQLLLPLVGRD